MEHLLTLHLTSLPFLLTFSLLKILSPSASTSPSSFSLDAIVFPDLNTEVYFKTGDLNIGAIMMLTTTTNGQGCSKKLYPNSWDIEYTEAVAFAVEVVNNDTKLLPNLTMGFYVIDDCSDPKISLAQSLTFLPRDETTCAADSCNGTSPAENNSYPLSSQYKSQAIPHYDVMGILSPILSTSAVPVSYLMSAAKLPIIGYTTTSDEFNDKALHPYFLRVVTANKYQAIAMLKFISSNGWSYISVVYSQGTYGERAFETLKGYATLYNICIANSYRVGNDENMDPVADGLLKTYLARVVVLFADEQPVRNLFTSIEKKNVTGHFIWICCDSVSNASKEKLRQHLKNVVGAFMFIYNTVIVPEFYNYIRRQNVSTSTNPWFKPSWEKTANCSIDNGTCELDIDITKLASFDYSSAPSLAMDAVLTFAHGADLLISKNCPHARDDDLRACVKRDLLLDNLYNVSFKGYTGTIKFDRANDFQGTYNINQMTLGTVVVRPRNDEENGTSIQDLVQKMVAYFDASTSTLNYTNTISWDHLLEQDRLIPVAQSTQNPDIPESVCSRPCVPGEYKIQKELPCCWDCRRCRDNEQLFHNGTSCKPCQEFTWPDPETAYSTCRDIPLTHLQPSDTVPVILIILAIIAIAGNVLVVASYIYYLDTRVMKAASRELSFLQMGGVFVGYITVICFQTRPTPTMCSALFFMFCLSFAWLYSPLLVKAVRIYRIFQSGSKNNQRPRFVSPMSQVILSLLIILSQIILCLVMYIIYKPSAKKTQAVITEKFVELSCDMTIPGLASFLVYNLVLVSSCAIFAFKTRKLPDNFNESRFISMCVYTTLIIWLAFIPTYFTAGQEYLRGVLLSIALLLNHTVAVLFLFMPKVYATMFLDPENLVINRFQTRGTSLDLTGSCNRVGAAQSVTLAAT